MKATKDTNREATDIIGKAEGRQAASATTSEIIEDTSQGLKLCGPWDRVGWVCYTLFEGGCPEEFVSEEIDSLVYDISAPEPLGCFLSWVSENLLDDESQFRYTAFDADIPQTKFYFLRYAKREAFAYPAKQQQPIPYLAGILNCVLQPDYELRRFTDSKLGKDGILMPLTPQDWEILTTIYGPMAIEARFTVLHAQKKQGRVYSTPR